MKGRRAKIAEVEGLCQTAAAPTCQRESYAADIYQKPLTQVSKQMIGAHGKRSLERGWQKRLAKGCERLAKG